MVMMMMVMITMMMMVVVMMGMLTATGNLMRHLSPTHSQSYCLNTWDTSVLGNDDDDDGDNDDVMMVMMMVVMIMAMQPNEAAVTDPQSHCLNTWYTTVLDDNDEDVIVAMVMMVLTGRNSTATVSQSVSVYVSSQRLAPVGIS